MRCGSEMSQRTFALAVLTLICSVGAFAGCAANNSSDNWRSALEADCERCASAKWVREHAPFQVPERAISYSSTGATSVAWWSVNLDNGEITKWESPETKTTGSQAKITHPGVVDAGKLAKLRAAAVRLWRSEPPSSDSIWMSSGMEMEDEVISGQRLVPFHRYYPGYEYIVTAIESALPEDAATVTRFR